MQSDVFTFEFAFLLRFTLISQSPVPVPLFSSLLTDVTWKDCPVCAVEAPLALDSPEPPKLFDVFEVLSVMNDVHWPVLVLLIAFSELDVDEDEDMWEEGSRGWMGQGWGREPVVKTAAWAEGGAVEGGGGRGDCAALSFCVLRLALKYVQ